MKKLFMLAVFFGCLGLLSAPFLLAKQPAKTEKPAATATEEKPQLSGQVIAEDEPAVLDDSTQTDSTREEGGGATIGGDIGSEAEFHLAAAAILALLMYIFGLLSSKIPVLNQINDTWQRIISVGVLFGLGYLGYFYHFQVGLGNLLTWGAAFVFATKTLHPIGEQAFGIKTSKTKVAKTELAAKAKP